MGVLSVRGEFPPGGCRHQDHALPEPLPGPRRAVELRADQCHDALVRTMLGVTLLMAGATMMVASFAVEIAAAVDDEWWQAFEQPYEEFRRQLQALLTEKAIAHTIV
jgi:hypothetical protein